MRWETYLLSCDTFYLTVLDRYYIIEINIETNTVQLLYTKIYVHI
jgi:hypothetical protein